ncbi:MAG: hypothetical protein UY91_C0027G0004 [Parcubacteria group bacterium GW2011_GWB1_55_9]|nr:MAG: hypothetical protein UY91_C0027G0004 [Parcubacteria group bacterium GW2011_GWB1_55_9]
MHNELTNLLPPERQRALSRGYLARFITVIVFMGIALILIAAALLLPSYVLLAKNEHTKKDYLANSKSAISSAEEKDLSTRLSVLSANTAALIALGKAPSASAAVRTMLALPRPGIALSDFSYTSAAGKKPGALVVSGTAKTRDALRSYQTTLQNAPFARSADLPVSAYAKDSDIAFTITITLAL